MKTRHHRQLSVAEERMKWHSSTWHVPDSEERRKVWTEYRRLNEQLSRGTQSPGHWTHLVRLVAKSERDGTMTGRGRGLAADSVLAQKNGSTMLDQILTLERHRERQGLELRNPFVRNHSQKETRPSWASPKMMLRKGLKRRTQEILQNLIQIPRWRKESW